MCFETLLLFFPNVKVSMNIKNTRPVFFATSDVCVDHWKLCMPDDYRYFDL